MHQLFDYYKPFFCVHSFFINIIISFSSLNKKLSPLIKCELTTTFKTAESSGRLFWSGVSQSRIILHLVWYFVPTVATNFKRFFKRIHCNRHVLSRGKVDIIRCTSSDRPWCAYSYARLNNGRTSWWRMKTMKSTERIGSNVIAFFQCTRSNLFKNWTWLVFEKCAYAFKSTPKSPPSVCVCCWLSRWSARYAQGYIPF